MDVMQILYPLYVMVALTAYVTIRMGRLRVKAVKEDGLRPSYFHYNRGGEPPKYMLRYEQHYENLFEIPVLFYVAVLVIYSSGSINSVNLVLAWCFVLLRIAHSIIHLGRNRLLLRRKVFIWGVVILFALWTSLIVPQALSLVV